MEKLRHVLLLAAIAGRSGWAATDADCTRILEQALADKNPETRKEAVVALSLVGPQGALSQRLGDMLQDKDVVVRQAAVASLSELKTKAAKDALHRALS